jgi:hypothetical protein
LESLPQLKQNNDEFEDNELDWREEKKKLKEKIVLFDYLGVCDCVGVGRIVRFVGDDKQEHSN